MRVLFCCLALVACDDTAVEADAEAPAQERNRDQGRRIAPADMGLPVQLDARRPDPDASPADARTPDAAPTPDGGECCTLGERRCVDDGSYAVCGEGSDACWRFSEPFGCGAGSLCEAGQCSEACQACDVVGEVRCVGARREQCQAQGACTAWVEVADPGSACAGGGCVDACPAAGARSCTPDGEVRVCRAGPEGCLVIQDGGGCSPGRRECNGAAGFRTCTRDADGCYGWVAADCAPGTDCLADSAACFGAGCVDECVAGDFQCLAGDRFRQCSPGPGGCAQWQERNCLSPAPCADSPRRCVGECFDRCELGSRRCSFGVPDGAYEICAEDEEGCLDFRAEPCAAGTCFEARGACFGECEVACEIGARECTADGYQECVADFDGCPEWRPRPCQGQAECAEAPAECFGACRFVCVEGDQRCSFALPEGQYEVCARDEVGCLEWQVRDCAAGTCEGARAACFGECEAGCELDARECLPEGRYRECEADFRGCPSWQERLCFRGAECAEAPGECFGECGFGCDEGATRCSFNLPADQYERCERDALGCLEYTPRPCAEGACREAPGLCFGACEVDCEPGTRQCLDGRRYQLCELDFDGCPEWVERGCQGVEDCADAPGECFGQCNGGCAEGTQRCSFQLPDGQYELCVRGEDGCTAYQATPCVEGTCDDARRACFGTCEGEGCALGAQRCGEGILYETCEADFEGCPNWREHFCATGRDCVESEAACFGECERVCFEGERGCVGDDQWRTCEADERGCFVWVERPCGNDQRCPAYPDACYGECQDECVDETRECTPDGYRECWRNFDGCTEWLDRQCQRGADCALTPNACYGDCFNACDLDEARCLFQDEWQGCELGPEGCTVWGAGQACAGEESCFLDLEACQGPR